MKKIIMMVLMLLTISSPISVLAAEDENAVPTEIMQQYCQVNWEKCDVDTKKALNKLLANAVAEDLNISAPEIKYFQDRTELLGYYDYGTNEIFINENNLFSAQYNYHPLCHEMRHVWQYSRAQNPQTEEDIVFKYNFENYISDDQYNDYITQYIERDANIYADMLYMQLIDNVRASY